MSGRSCGSFFPPPPRTWVPVPVNRGAAQVLIGGASQPGDTGETPAPGREDDHGRNRKEMWTRRLEYQRPEIYSGTRREVLAGMCGGTSV